MQGSHRLEMLAGRLSGISRANRYNVYDHFDWPEELRPDSYWLSPELMSCYRTTLWAELNNSERIGLSHFEAVNFFSLNVHLIRELIGQVADRMYCTRYDGLSEFFHDFVREENEHAWFFASFCKRYGGQIYATRRIVMQSEQLEGVLQDLMVFGRILIAEEICDFFNSQMARDDRLPAIVQRINLVHHQDESRHIAFGRQMMRVLREEAAREAGEEGIDRVSEYLSRYISTCFRSFYNRQMYSDAGMSDPAVVRKCLLEDQNRKAAHRDIAGRTVRYLQRIGVIDVSTIDW